MYKFFVGCDVSKAVIDVSYHDGSKPIYLGQINNNNKVNRDLIRIRWINIPNNMPNSSSLDNNNSSLGNNSLKVINKVNRDLIINL